ncbi:unnamed protein product [Amoebophrya sp. A25]|nr:unnamed protein product [Amoebophrya sp. A25]|eukprot:GSA25T00002917001.1
MRRVNPSKSSLPRCPTRGRIGGKKLQADEALAQRVACSWFSGSPKIEQHVARAMKLIEESSTTVGDHHATGTLPPSLHPPVRQSSGTRSILPSPGEYSSASGEGNSCSGTTSCCSQDVNRDSRFLQPIGDEAPVNEPSSELLPEHEANMLDDGHGVPPMLFRTDQHEGTSNFGTPRDGAVQREQYFSDEPDDCNMLDRFDEHNMLGVQEKFHSTTTCTTHWGRSVMSCHPPEVTVCFETRLLCNKLGKVLEERNRDHFRTRAFVVL